MVHAIMNRNRGGNLCEPCNKKRGERFFPKTDKLYSRLFQKGKHQENKINDVLTIRIHKITPLAMLNENSLIIYTNSETGMPQYEVYIA